MYTRRQTQKIHQPPKNKIPNEITISFIIPVFNGPVQWLHQAIESIKNQSQKNWELCIVDDNSTNQETIEFLKNISDPRIRIQYLSKNSGISNTLNTGVAMSSGSYLTFLDQDDTLEPDTLQMVIDAIQKFDPCIIYTDEDMQYEGWFGKYFFKPHFKPDYSPALLISNNYITHLMVVKRNVLNACGFFRSEFDGAQDYDLILRATEYANTICHIRKVLYHWRIHKNSTSNALKSGKICTAAGKHTLEETLKRRMILGTVEEGKTQNIYHIKREINRTPLVNIVIPINDHPEFLDQCLQSIYSKTTYSSYQILLVDNSSSISKTKLIIQKWCRISSKIHVIPYPYQCNYSSMNNYAISLAIGEFIVLMNNNIEILSPEWIEALLEHAQNEENGAVGGKLYYPDGTIHHAGITVDISSFAGYPYRGCPGHAKGYFNHLISTRNVSAVTGALMMVKRSKYLEVGGFDEENLQITFPDVDFCIRLLEKGYLNVFTPFCEAVHFESISRGYEDSLEKHAKFQKEYNYCVTRHKKFITIGDPWNNSNFSFKDETMEYTRDIPDEKRYGIFRRGRKRRFFYDPIINEDAKQ